MSTYLFPCLAYLCSVCLVLRSTHAFVAPLSAARPATVRSAVPGLVGDMAPMGFFDPLGFSKGKTLKEVKRPANLESKLE